MTTHGMSGTPTYSSWKMMIQRCTNPRNGNYAYYGAKGVKVCERWLTFENFLEDMGERKGYKTIERVNRDGDYEPSNCRWATRKEQAQNRRDTRLITLHGVTKSLTQWAREKKLGVNMIRSRLARGWSIEDAFTIKADKSGRLYRRKTTPRRIEGDGA